jgi:hypothetical protein
MSRSQRTDRLELLLLQGARHELGPTPQQRRALRSSVLAQVGLAEALSAAPQRPSGIRSASAPQLELVEGSAGAPVADALKVRPSVLGGLRFGWRVLTGATLSGVLVGLGAGYLAFGAATQPAPEHAHGPARVTTPTASQLPLGAPPAFVLPGEDLSAQEEVTTAERQPRGALSTALVSPSASEKAAPGVASLEAPAPLSFYEELTYLRRAQAALRRKEPALALGLMQSLDGLNTAGALLSERAMTKVLALCLLERAEEATDVARRLITAEGGALYVDRISHSCAAAAVAEAMPAAEEVEFEVPSEEKPGDIRE